MRPSLLICLLTLVSACQSGGDRNASASSRGGKAGQQVVLVEVARAQRGKLADRWTFLGNVRAGMHAEIAAAAAGEVRWVGPREGDRVAKGALLLRVDARVARAKLQAAKAREKRAVETLAQARREVARFSRLTREARSELELERSQSAVRLAQAEGALLVAQSKEAAAQLALHRLKAPFAGVITRRLVDPGDWVSVGTRVLDLVSSEALEVLVDVSPRLLQFVDRESKAMLLPSAGGEIPARVVGVVGALDPVARTARVRLLPEKDATKGSVALRAGAAVRVAFNVRREGGVVVPRDALVVAATSTRVVKIVDGKAQPLVVDVLATTADRALVMPLAAKGGRGAALRPGDTLVVRGNERVRPGQRVRVAGGKAKAP